VLVISEHHPLWEIGTVRGPGELAVNGDYVGIGRDGHTDPLKAPQVAVLRIDRRVQQNGIGSRTG
jgi:hypothetical protein